MSTVNAFFIFTGMSRKRLLDSARWRHMSSTTRDS
jgi:hypothetical protein